MLRAPRLVVGVLPASRASVRRGAAFRAKASRGGATLSLSNLPKNVLECEYAVRGAVVLRAEELKQTLALQKAGKATGEPLPFDEIVSCNIGNPQEVGAKPLLFHRQVLACLAEPSLVQNTGLFPEDVRDRAVHLLSGAKDAKMGAYSHSKGHQIFRHDVANFLTARDGLETDIEDIFLTDGASPAVKTVLQMCIGGPKDAVLLPIPQYPLYSATMSILGGRTAGYFLDEEAGWGISVSELERAVNECRADGGNPRAIVVINPGNPTGSVMSRDVMENVLKFADREGLVLLADEVYQENIYTDTKSFISFRSLAHELGVKCEVFSFHSISKGFYGECGLRGGLVHCHNVDKEVIEQMYKLVSVNLCSNVLGQAMVASILTPPPVGGPSRANYDAERDGTLTALRRKAKLVTERLNAIDGITCQPIEGAMYAFPKVIIKGYVMKKAISYATPADQIYCLEMVERTGVVTVPGSGFGQRPGHFHFRTTILPTEDAINGSLDRIEKFHREHEHGWFP